jgi:hypothetical protein
MTREEKIGEIEAGLLASKSSLCFTFPGREPWMGEGETVGLTSRLVQFRRGAHWMVRMALGELEGGVTG